VATLAEAARTRTFWALAVGFAICGASTNGLIATHFIPSAHDHGMPETTAAGLLAVVGVFDIVGTVASGWLTDKLNPRLLLAAYYGLRGAGLLMLPSLLSDSPHPSMIAFVVVYGLDWVATVPPTAALCREAFGEAGSVVFTWVFAAHQIGAAVVSVGAGVIRDTTGQYTMAWVGAACLCLVAAFVSTRVGRASRSTLDRPHGEAADEAVQNRLNTKAIGTATRIAAAWSDCQEKTSPRMSSRMRRANDRSAIQVAQTGSRKPLVSGRRKAGERPLRRTSDWETGRYVVRVDSPDIKSYKWGFARATLRHVNAMTKRSVIGSSVTAAHHRATWWPEAVSADRAGVRPVGWRCTSTTTATTASKTSTSASRIEQSTERRRGELMRKPFGEPMR
jgi:hypothetical protein